MFIKRISIYVLPAFFLLLVAFGSDVRSAHAVTVLSCYTNPVWAAWAVTTVPQFLLLLVDLVFLVAVPIIVVFIIYGGFLFVMAGGNEAKVTKARTVLLWTLIGAGVLLGAKAIEIAVQATICSLDPANPICTGGPSSSGYSC